MGNPGSLSDFSKAPRKQSFHMFESSSATVADLVQWYESNIRVRHFLCITCESLQQPLIDVSIKYLCQICTDLWRQVMISWHMQHE